jgi:hypothetical protein
MRLIPPPKPTRRKGEYTKKAMELLDQAWQSTYELECRLAQMRQGFGNWMEQLSCPKWMRPVRQHQNVFSNAKSELGQLDDPYTYIESLEEKIVDQAIGMNWRALSGHKLRMQRRGYVMKRKPGRRAK